MLFVGFGLVTFLFTHGTTRQDQMGTLLGLEGTAYGRLQVVWPALLLVGLVVVRSKHADRLRNSGRRGLNVAVLALAVLVVNLVMQWRLKDGHVAEDFASVTLTLGFSLGALSYLVLAVGMTLFGVDPVRRGALGWASRVPLAIRLVCCRL